MTSLLKTGAQVVREGWSDLWRISKLEPKGLADGCEWGVRERDYQDDPLVFGLIKSMEQFTVMEQT